MNLKYQLGEDVEYNTRFRQWEGAWVPARIIEINHSMDEAGMYTLLTLRLYSQQILRLSEVEQKLCIRPLKSRWDKDKKEWVR